MKNVTVFGNMGRRRILRGTVNPAIRGVAPGEIGVKGCTELTVPSSRLFRALRLAMIGIHVRSFNGVRVNGAKYTRAAVPGQTGGQRLIAIGPALPEGCYCGARSKSARGHLPRLAAAS
jgi:hypothetical protein